MTPPAPTVDPGPPADAAAVLDALRACSHHDVAVRGPAEVALRGWESSKSPGYLSALLSLVSPDAAGAHAVPPDLRLLAAILAKNSVPVIWGWESRDEDPPAAEGGAAPPPPSAEEADLRVRRRAERDAARAGLPALLFGEPDDRVALHLRLAIANAALFDFPDRWPSLLEDLAAAAGSSERGGAVRVRAVKCLRDVLQAVRHRKLVVKQGGLRSLVALQRLVKGAAEERERARARAAPAAGVLAARAVEHARSLAAAGPGWSLDGTLCAGYLKALAELFPLVTTHASSKAEVNTFLVQAALILQELRSYHLLFPPGGNVAEGGGAEGWTRLVDKVYRSTLLCCIAALGNMPLLFAPQFPPCFQAVLDSMLALDEANLHAIPAKRLVLQTKFVLKALCCMEYDPKPKVGLPVTVAALAGQGLILTPGGVQNSDSNQDPDLLNARRAVAGMLGEGICKRVVETLVTKFLRLTNEEVIEWDADPEGRYQADDAERTMMEIETPRHCGGLLLSCMMQREKEAVGQALLDLSQHYHQQPPQDLSNLLNWEACYGGMQICQPLMKKEQLDFPSWWEGELRALLQTDLGPQHPVPMRALQARAVQVVRAYSASLRERDFPVAFQTTAKLLVAPDLVTALHAAKCLNHLALMHLKEKEEPPQMVAVKENSVLALGNTFALANRVSSDECLRTTLLLVSGLVEANGTSLGQYLHAIAEQLPPLWDRAGDSAPIHSCLIAVLNHLIIKLGYPAVENAHVQKVLYPLLDYCTDITVAHRSETLLEDGLKLWLVTLLTSRMVTMGSSLTAMLPRLEAILRNGLEPYLSLQVLQFYAILMGSQVVEPLAETLVSLLLDCTLCVHGDSTDGKGDTDMVEESEVNGPSHGNESSQGGTLKDAMAAFSFMDALLQLFPSLGYMICNPAISKVLKTLPRKPLPAPLVEGVFGTTGRLLWFRPTALEEIFADDPDQSKHIVSIVQSWLQIVSGISFVSILNPSLGTASFIERKGAALSLCAAVCKSPKLATLVGHSVVKFTKSLQALEERMKIDIDSLVEASCGTARQVIGDGPLGDSATRTSEILKSDPLLTVSLKDALESASNALKEIPAPST